MTNEHQTNVSSLDYEGRIQAIKTYLINPMVGIFSPPKGMASNEAAKTEYVKALVEACNANLPTKDINRDSFVGLLERMSTELITSAEYRVWYMPNTVKKTARKHGQMYIAKTEKENRAFNTTPANKPQETVSKEHAHLNGWTLEKVAYHFDRIGADQLNNDISPALAHTMRKFPRVAMRRLFRAILNGEHIEAIPASLQQEFNEYQEEMSRQLDQALQG